jgi:hypothetical protein
MKKVVRSRMANPAELQATLNVVPAHIWYAASSGGLTFVNRRTADYLGLPKDHPLRFGVDIGARWDAHKAIASQFQANCNPMWVPASHMRSCFTTTTAPCPASASTIISVMHCKRALNTQSLKSGKRFWM